MNILLTGSAGHSGTAIIPLLRQQGHFVTGIDRLASPETDVVGDIQDPELIRKLVKGKDAIIHTASLHAPHVGHLSRQTFVDVNISGTLNLLEAAKLHGVQTFIYTSTTSVYGHALEDPNQAVWVTEDLTPQPRDIYDITKLAAEELGRDVSRETGMDVICLRVSRFWEEPLKDRVFYRMYRGLDVRDVAAAHLAALEVKDLGFESFIISGQPLFSQEDLHQIRTDVHPILKERIPELLRLFDQKGWVLPRQVDRIYVSEKARDMLGFQTQYNIREMISELTLSK